MTVASVAWKVARLIVSRRAVATLGIAVLWVPNARNGQAQGQQPVKRANDALAVRQVGKARWWIVPHREGNVREGKLFLGVVLENTSATAQFVALSFQSYASDGTKVAGCYGPGGGPGVVEEIEAGRRALISCYRSIVPVATRGLAVTARIWSIRPVPAAVVAATVLEARLESRESDGVFAAYNASFRVKVASGKDVRLKALARFYSDDGVQVATCTSNDLLVEPEVALRAACSSDVLLDVLSPAPTSVTVTLRAR